MRRSLVIRTALLGSLGLTLAGAAPRPEPETAPARYATFAGGCFWSVQKAFDGVPGVLTVVAGFAGGQAKNPTYDAVSDGATGHAEAVQIVYDPAKISYQRLLDIYWHHIDPTTPNAAFCDHGPQYRSIIFYYDAEQRKAAEASKAALDASHRFPKPVVTTIEPVTPFYPAGEAHQQYYEKNPEAYEAYRIGCRRDERLRQLWGAPADAKTSAQ